MKRKAIKVGMVLMVSSMLLVSVSCKKEGCTDSTAINYNEKAKKDDGSCKYAVNDEKTQTVTANITTNTTWTKDKVWILGTRVAVTNGATLTIEPGTIIKGEAGTGANATALIVSMNGTLIADGTASEPIIFTSVADEIQPGQIDSPNMDANLDGLWGGLIVLGKAPISAPNASMQIEGIPASDPNGLYGGSEDGHSSGVLRYISIRHGGANIGEGNEINGLTLGGVGSGTIIENIEVIANQDDGVEFFGGTVNVKNVIVWNSGDDSIDTDQAWSGTLDNFIVIAGETTDHALEIDGPEGFMMAAHVLKNGSIKGHPNSEIGDFRDGARISVSNLYVFDFPNPADGGKGDLALSGQASLDNFASGVLSFSNIEAALPSGVTLADVFLNGTHAHATQVSKGANTVGADKSVFAGWTFSDKRGQLADF